MDETIDWLSDYFLRSRLSKPELRSFGLYSTWTPYVNEVVSFWEYLISRLINMQLNSCSRESVGSSKITKGTCKMLCLMMKMNETTYLIADGVVI